jgi:hypothetical protein
MKHFGANIKNRIGCASTMVVTDPDRHVYNAVWVSLIQHHLALFTYEFNTSKIRKQKEKLMPSGNAPLSCLKDYEILGGIQCLLPVDDAIMNEMELEMGLNRGLLFFDVPNEIEQRLREFLQTNSNLEICFDNAGDVFTAVRDSLEPCL